MGEFEEKLQSILGNQEAMGQIMSIAQALGGGQGETAGQLPNTEIQSAPSEGGAPAGPDLSALLGNVDPRILQLGMRLLAEYNRQDEHKLALLAALRPYVRAERYAKVDKAVQIARLAHVIRTALDAFQKGDEGHV